MREIRKIQHNTPEWLEMRKSGIGASDAAAILGLSNWKTNIELWEEKVGLRKPDDISNEELVAFGNSVENYMFEIFKLKTASKYDCKKEKGIVYFKDDFQFASLDGHITDKRTGEQGVWECKTALSTPATWEAYAKNAIPQNYYIQLLHQLLVTGYSFNVITPIIHGEDANGLPKFSSFCRFIRADEEQVIADMKYLDEQERIFWQYVQRKERPPKRLPII